MFKVIGRFADLNDNKHIYEVGDSFPRFGLDVSEKRLQELSTSENKTGKPLIEEIVAVKSKEAEKAAERPLKKSVEEIIPEPKEPVIEEKTKPRGRRKKNAN